jgi:hypothetical protein
MNRRSFLGTLLAPVVARFAAKPQLRQWEPNNVQVLMIKSRQLGVTSMSMELMDYYAQTADKITGSIRCTMFIRKDA